MNSMKRRLERVESLAGVRAVPILVAVRSFGPPPADLAPPCYVVGADVVTVYAHGQHDLTPAELRKLERELVARLRQEAAELAARRPAVQAAPVAQAETEEPGAVTGGACPRCGRVHGGGHE